MSDDLGLSDLTDDQLLELGRALLHEVRRRSVETQDGITGALLDERDRIMAMRDGAALEIAAERDRQRRLAADEGRAHAAAMIAIEREARQAAEEAERATRAAELARARWEPLVTIAAMATELLGPGWTIERWSKDADLRVYLSGPDCRRGAGRFGATKTGSYVEYYVTGNDRAPPGKLALSKVAAPRKAVRVLCDLVARSAVTKLECAEALASGIAPAPFSTEFEEARNGK